MRSHIARVVAMAGVILSACDTAPETQNVASDRALPVAETPTTTGDSASGHAGHQTATDTVAPASAPQATDHSAHLAPAPGGAAPAVTAARGDEHRGHTGGGVAARVAPRGDATHAGHAAPRGDAAHAAPAAAAHAGHVAPRPAAAHAAHVAQRPDTAHAAHAQHVAPRPDTAHAAHAQNVAPRPDPAHAAHAAPVTPRPDPAHAAHAAPSADTAHAAHGGHAATPSPASTHAGHATPTASAPGEVGHEMWMRDLGSGWMALGMAQAFPIVSTSLGAPEGSSLDVTELYVTQPAIMFNIESPGSRFTLRTTLNFEGITQKDGEVTFGGWGEGFIDRRHPHTLLHEFMLSANGWNVGGGDLSVSIGKGFAPYGTDDPMSRPPVKYPTNHHLSQILERWTANAVYLNSGWSIEAGLFGGGEPEGPYDLSNIESFGDSWSTRVAKRFGSGRGPLAETELSASFGRVREVHHEEAVVTKLYNAALRHERAYGVGTLYGLVEASMSEPEEDEGYFSILGETQLTAGAHRPYYRVEYATRPEYGREGAPGTDGFFRYDHDAHAIGATRWLINTMGYGYELTGYPISARPFVELQHSAVKPERGGITPEALFTKRSFWGLTAGFRVFLGGDPMRMGSYGVLDPMTTMHRGGAGHDMAAPGHTGHE